MALPHRIGMFVRMQSVGIYRQKVFFTQDASPACDLRRKAWLLCIIYSLNCEHIQVKKKKKASYKFYEKQLFVLPKV